jgi:hypothetical protein
MIREQGTTPQGHWARRPYAASKYVRNPHQGSLGPKTYAARNDVDSRMTSSGSTSP